ncbi:MAG: DUF3568 family protein [Phycisphaerales bacterium]|nr:DUF3568 family protein [Phycisphaerales bacterium]
MKIHCVVLVAATLVALSACEATPKQQGSQSQLTATYKMGALSAVIPAKVPVVMAAAEQTLRDRGYAIESSASTTEQGGIVARPPAYNLGKTIKIDVASTATDQTSITLSAQPWDETLLRITLDRILARLGM